jgi:hypothetical protein
MFPLFCYPKSSGNPARSCDILPKILVWRVSVTLGFALIYGYKLRNTAFPFQDEEFVRYQ